MRNLRRYAAKHSIDGVFVLLCFCVFAACVLMVLLTGARAYRGLVDRDAASYSQSIAVRYVSAKIRHADAADSIFVGDFSGVDLTGGTGDTLFLKETDDGQIYYTRIYCDKGCVRELFAAASGKFERTDGNAILRARKLRFSLDRQAELLTVFSTDQRGRTAEITLALRSREAMK